MNEKVKGLTSGVMIGALALTVGCDRISFGGVWRQVQGRKYGLEAELAVPVIEVRAKKELAPQLDTYLSGQFAVGETEAQDYSITLEGEGNLESLGVGFDYFFSKSRRLGLEMGTEVFHAEYGVTGKWGKLRHRESDQFCGYAFNLALIGEIPNNLLVWRIGHHFAKTQIEHSEIEVDLNGWYVSLGLEISLKR